ncbi:MAG: family 16 glycosylhydrolase [Hyphomonadaceae bacterium]
MSVTGPPPHKVDTPSVQIDAIVIAVCAFVCFTGIFLSAPPPDSTPDTPTINADLDPGTSSDPETVPALDAPDIVPDTSPDATTPTTPPVTPPPDIETPSLKPEQPAAGLPAVTLRDLPDLAPNQLIPSGRGFISLMGDHHDPTNWHRSTHSATGTVQATDWKSDNAIYGADGLSLKLEHAPGRPNKYHSGEIQTRQTYGYGRYEVLMRPAKATGTVSSFFTYTGPYHGDPHDEVDIEFLGEDTTKIFLNYFRNGRVGEHQTLDLPFDAAEEFHLYAFEWRPDAITWFVDGQPLHQTKIHETGIPRTPGLIIVNLWSGLPRLRSWHGTPDFTDPVQAQYGCISFQPIGGTGRSCSTVFPPVTSEIDPPRTNIFVRTAGRFLNDVLPGKIEISQTN